MLFLRVNFFKLLYFITLLKFQNTVLDHFFDPTYHANVASGRDPNVLAPLFAQAYTPLPASTQANADANAIANAEAQAQEKAQAQGEITVISHAFVRKVVDAGTQVGCDESAHAAGVLQVLSDHAANLSQLLVQMYLSFTFFYMYRLDINLL